MKLVPIMVMQLLQHMEKRSCDCVSSDISDNSKSFKVLCSYLLLFIFALATMHCDETIRNLSLVCKTKRFYKIICSSAFRNIKF